RLRCVSRKKETQDKCRQCKAENHKARCDNAGGYSLEVVRPSKSKRSPHDDDPTKYRYLVSAVPGNVLSDILAASKGLARADDKETRANMADAESILSNKKYDDATPANKTNRAFWLQRARARALRVSGDPSLAKWLELVPPTKRGARSRPSTKL